MWGVAQTAGAVLPFPRGTTGALRQALGTEGKGLGVRGLGLSRTPNRPSPPGRTAYPANGELAGRGMTGSRVRMAFGLET